MKSISKPVLSLLNTYSRLINKKLILYVCLLSSFCIYSQYEVFVDEYSKEECVYPFIRDGIKIEFLFNNNPEALVFSKYDLKTREFVPIKAFYIKERYDNYNKDGYNWLFLEEDTFGEFLINYNPNLKKATFALKNSTCNQKFSFILIEEEREKINAFIEKNPDNSAAYIERGSFKYSKLNDFKGAIEDFNKAISLNPKNSKAFYNRAYSKYYLDDLDGACSDWIKSESLGNKNALNSVIKYCGDDFLTKYDSSTLGEVFFKRASYNVDNNDYKQAINDYTKTIELGYQVKSSYINRANLKVKLKDYIGGIQDYEKSVSEGNASFWEIYRKTAVLRKEKLNDYEGAIKDYIKIIEGSEKLSLENPNFNEYFYSSDSFNVGELKFSLGDLNGACAYWIIAFVGDRTPAVINRLKNNCGDDIGFELLKPKYQTEYLHSIAYYDKFLKEKDYEGSLKLFEKILEIDSNNRKAFFWIGYVKTLLKDYEGAIISYKKVLEIKPNDENAKRNLDKVLMLYNEKINAEKE